MSWRQFMHWQDYRALDPGGEQRADLRAGIIASVIANCNRDPRKGKPFTPSDFMVKFDREVNGNGGGVRGSKKSLSPERWKEIKSGFALAIGGGTVIR